jgi:hypothetical protein
MRDFLRRITCAALVVSISHAVAATDLEFDHVWIVVTRDAPERTALEHAGLKISLNVNRHEARAPHQSAQSFLTPTSNFYGRIQRSRSRPGLSVASRSSNSE